MSHGRHMAGLAIGHKKAGARRPPAQSLRLGKGYHYTLTILLTSTGCPDGPGVHSVALDSPIGQVIGQ